MDALNEFLASDGGFILGLVAVFLGIMDLIVIKQVFWKRYQQTRDEKLRRLVTYLAPITMVWFALGIYVMWLHYGR